MPVGRGVSLAYGFTLLAAIANAADEGRGVIFYERFLGSSNDLGNVLRLDSTLGYSFNQHFSVDGGLPVFFVHPSDSTTALTGATSANGIGNAYLELRYALPHPLVNYTSLITGTAPTGDKSRGLSTGRATLDWINHFDRSFGRLTPFGNIGFANTVSDTPLFVRPYTTLGFITHLEGGATYRITRFVDAGAGGYAIEPAGQQTLISELATRPANAPSPPGGNKSPGNSHSVLENAPVTVGSADLVRDYGFSVWGGVHPARALTLQVGYTHSTRYSLDTVTFGVGVNLGSVVKSMRSY